MGFLSSGSKAAEPQKTAPQKSPSPPAGLSVIAVGMAVHGHLDSNGTVKIEGSVEGNVSTRAQALVAKGGVVHGDLSAEEVIVGGTVTGAVRGRTRVEIQTGAVVEGDVTTSRILVAEGATLNGRVRMGERLADSNSATEELRASAGAVGFAGPARPSVPVARVAVPPRPPLP